MRCALPILILSLLTGCIGTSNRHVCDGVDLIKHGQNETEMRFCKRSWGGVFGPHGYVGFETKGYGAILLGKGPTFSNPIFIDNSGNFRCFGTITLNQESNRVMVNMRRIVSEFGKTERTKHHPANGTYTISSMRDAYPDEREGFRKWLQREEEGTNVPH